MPVPGRFSPLLLCLVLFGCTASARPSAHGRAALSDGTTEYTIKLAEPQTQMVDVSIRIHDPGPGPVEFVMPAWRPGRYAILDQAGGVRDVRAADAAGTALSVHKTDKSTWRVEPAQSRTVVLSYRVYANALAERTRHVDDSHAFLDPTAALMYAPDRRSNPVTVSIDAPETWDIATGLDPLPSDPRSFVAPNYDILADSPFEIGEHETVRFDVDGIPHEIVIWGRHDASQRDLPGDFAQIIRTQRDIFGDLPYERYVFIIHCTPAVRGATEHLNSTVVQAAGSVFDTRKAYRGFLGLIAHEFFHTWNIKQLRPAEFKPYDFIHENYTTSLWIAEGTTSYFDSLSLVRAGLLEPDEYLRARAEAIASLLETPGRHAQSLEESSFDAWIKFSKSSPDKVNSTISFYSKGALVSLLLDLELRNRSGGRVSLDLVMREMYTAFPLAGPGYTADDFRAMVERTSGSNFGEFFADFVQGTQELPLADAFSVVGLSLAFEPDKEAVKEGRPDPAAYIGLDLTDRNGVAVVDSVRADGPAYSAGIIAGDEVIAMDGVRLRAADLASRLDLLHPGDPVRLTLFRREQLREIEFPAGGRARGAWRLSRIADPTGAQVAAYESWLKQPWPSDAGPPSADPPP